MSSRLPSQHFHQLFRPHTFWQWVCVLLLPWFTLFPALAHNGFFFSFLAVLPLPVWVVLSVIYGLITGTTYYPIRRGWFAGILPGLIAGPCVVLIVSGYTSQRMEVYKAEIVAVTILSLAPALAIYYLSLRFLLLRKGSETAGLSDVEFIDDEVRDVVDLLADEPQAASAGRSVRTESDPSRMTPRAWVLSGVVVLLLFTALVSVALHEGGGGRVTSVLPTGADAGPQTQAVAPISISSAVNELRSGDVVRRRAAARQLSEPANVSTSEEPQQELIAALTDCLDDEDLAVRRSAVKALGLWCTRNETPVLIACLKDPDALTRFEAMDALARVGDAAAAAAIAERLAIGQDRQRASAALRVMGPTAEQAARSGLNHDDVWVRIEACRVLAEVGTAECLTALEGARSDPNGLVAGEAEQAVAAVRARAGR